MVPIDLEMRAYVVIIPPELGGMAALPCWDVSVASAIRYVVGELSGDERSRAVVCTPAASLFINEIRGALRPARVPQSRLTEEAVRLQAE